MMKMAISLGKQQCMMNSCVCLLQTKFYYTTRASLTNIGATLSFKVTFSSLTRAMGAYKYACDYEIFHTLQLWKNNWQVWKLCMHLLRANIVLIQDSVLY